MRAALPTCPKCCCLSSSAPCTNGINWPCFYLAARKMWVKVGKFCPSWKGGALDISKSDTFFTLSQHSGIRSHYFNSYFKVEERNSAFAAILVPLLKTIPSSNWIALVGAKMMYGCVRWKIAAAKTSHKKNISHRDKSWHWLLDLTYPWTKSVWCMNIPALLFPVCPFCKKSVPAAALKIIYSTVLPQARKSWNSKWRLRTS